MLLNQEYISGCIIHSHIQLCALVLYTGIRSSCPKDAFRLYSLQPLDKGLYKPTNQLPAYRCRLIIIMHVFTCIREVLVIYKHRHKCLLFGRCMLCLPTSLVGCAIRHSNTDKLYLDAVFLKMQLQVAVDQASLV